MKSTLFATVSRREQRALLVLVGLGVCGHFIRAATAPAPQAAAPLDLLDHAGDKDPALHRDSSVLMAMPLRPGERIDVDKASAVELGRLPGVGPALARKIVTARDSNGPFGGVAGLDRVPGVGPGMLAKLAPRISFGGVAADTTKGPTATISAIPSATDLNLATAIQLEALPGIGTKRAKSIVAFRDSAGPFREVADLKRVRGITAKVVAALADRLVVH